MKTIELIIFLSFFLGLILIGLASLFLVYFFDTRQKVTNDSAKNCGCCAGINKPEPSAKNKSSENKGEGEVIPKILPVEKAPH